MITTRIAPSPTGLFHIGTARTAYFNWLTARSTAGKFILRIDDTDIERNNEEHVDLIKTSLDWLGLDYDGFYRQSERLELYKKAAEDLINKGFALKDDNGGVRLNWTGNVPEAWMDLVGGPINVSRQDAEISRQFILLRADGIPAYNFATVVDDIALGITEVIRGADHISNTLRQIVCRMALTGKEYSDFPYTFSHVGLIHKNGKKISKRDPTITDLTAYKNAGYTADTMLAYLLRLGWNMPDPEIDKKHPIITKDLALQLFTKGHMRPAPSNFDQAKLDWIKKKLQRNAA